MTGLIRQLYNNVLPEETRLQLYKLRHRQEYENLRKSVFHSPKGDFALKPFDEHQCIFIHITKTAGTSVAKSLFHYLPYHYTAIQYRVIYGRDTFNNYFKFAFVRNPWDRIYSAYRYLKSGGWNEEDRLWAENHLADFDNFGDFVKQWLTKENIAKHIHFKPQSHFICDSKGRLLVNYLGYFETLNDDFRKISEHMKIDANIGHHNANPATSYHGVYDEESRKIVAYVYAVDIELFGYNFNGIHKRRTVND